MQKILIIDDAEFILESTSTLLRFEGYEVYTASDGKTGIQTALEVKPDLILCDISMPGIDGFQVLSKIRETPEIATVPFIFLTAFTEKQNMRLGMEKGADDYLVKPYTRDE
ncbi:MAG TPA: response regulator, partial [Candidatus Kapabacteria bacterium]|nr:response regulator [Candidatus Kapabacteria bacterium]